MTSIITHKDEILREHVHFSRETAIELIEEFHPRAPYNLDGMKDEDVLALITSRLNPRTEYVVTLGDRDMDDRLIAEDRYYAIGYLVASGTAPGIQAYIDVALNGLPATLGSC